jgi:hypothetical protein
MQSCKDCFKQMSAERILGKTTWQIVWARTLVLAQSQDDFS